MSQKIPILKPADMVKTLKKAGFYIVRQTGGHIIMYKKGVPRPIPIPIHPRELKRNLQNHIIKEAGLTAEEFLKLLQD